MTNKEAIELIKDIEEDGRNVDSEKMKALDLAIKALEQTEVKGDLISREALKKALDEQMNFEENCRDSVFDIIDNAPTAEQKNIVIIPPELITELAETVVGIIKDIDWKAVIEKMAEKPKGEWLFHRCNKCGKGYDKNINLDNYHFCPNCGADMRGEET